jgi:diaminopimelate epimerase
MGEPVLEPKLVPADVAAAAPVIDYPLDIEGRRFHLTLVSMGNPHAVIFLDEDVSKFPVKTIGPLIENHPMFPRRTNVEFVNVVSSEELIMRVWERGSGETLACGTGASATGVAAMLKGLTGRGVKIRLLGGDLFIEWSGDNRVYMTGPAAEVFKGELHYDE